MPSGRSGTRRTAYLLLLALMLAALGVGGSSLVRMPEVAAPGDTIRLARQVAAATANTPAGAPTGPRVRRRPSPMSATVAPTGSPTENPPAPSAGAPAPTIPEAPKAAEPAALPPDVQTAIPEDAAAPEPDIAADGDAALIEVQLGRLARRVMKTYWSGSRLLLPLDAWLDFAEVSHHVDSLRISGRVLPAGSPFAVDAGSGTARVGNRQLPIAPGDMRVVDGQVYASLELVSGLFGFTGEIDRESAALFIHDPDDLPIARRLQREAARSIQVGGDAQVENALIYRGPELGRPGLVLSYDVRGSSQPGTPTSYALAAGSGLAGGSAVVRGEGSSGTAARVEGSWIRGWSGRRLLTQLRLGDGVMTGPRPQTSFGFSIGNAPITRSLLVEDLPFTGTLPPDWSVEAYRAGRLVAFDSADGSGRYSITLPVQYGENPVDFVAYGPLGEVRTFNRTFRALPSMVPAGTWEYGVSAGACRIAACDARANLDLRHGLSRRWTAHAGLDQVWHTGPGGSFYPYAGIAGSPTNALGVELEGVARLLTRTSIRVEPSTALRLTADYVSYAGSDSASLLVPPGTREQWSLYGRFMPGRRTGAVVLESQLIRTVTNSGMRSEARAGAALQLPGAVVRPYARWERTSAPGAPARQSFVGLQATVLPRRSLGPLLSGFWLQGQMEAEGARSVTSAAVSVARNLGQAFRLEVGTRWERAQPAPVFTLSLVSQLAAVRSTSIVTASPGAAETRLDQSIGGSVVWGRVGTAPVFSSEPSLDRGGVGGRVFVDLNGDGLWQPGEPTAPGTRLLVANRWVTADANGRYQLWGVPPWEELLVSVDTASLASPWWTPGHAAEGVTPTPNLVRRVDVPLVVGGVIEGQVLLDGPASRPLARTIPIALMDLDRGTRTVLESFSDGTFYRMGLPPGRYAATVSDTLLAPMGLRADTLRFELRPSRTADEPGPSLNGLTLMLRPSGSE